MNRAAITANRLHYDKEKELVRVLYNNYRKQKGENVAPKAYRYMLPIEAIHQIVQHKLPPYFQRSRYYGIHSSIKYKSIKNKIDTALKRNTDTIKLLFMVLNYLLGIQEEKQSRTCIYCQSGINQICILRIIIKFCIFENES